MAKAFYLKLSWGNLLRNKRMYGPYCVATALMSGMFFIILNLVFSQSIANLSYGDTVQAMFTIGIVVMTLFTVGYMLYINSFLIKRRKKEFGLYGVLGMEKRHVARVILWESIILSVGSLALGLIGGAIFGRLAFMLLMNILDTAKGSTFVISGAAIAVTLVIFLAIFFLTTLYNLNQVRLSNPIDLLKGGQKGEKRVRFVVPATILGVLMLGAAYYMAITTNSPPVALMLFWPAVILVILATWLLFNGGSVFILRALQKNKRIYYRPRNFITLSGLSHRMKQNAAGLSNICILSTMVMVTVSCCCALYLGQDVIVKEQNPSDIRLELRLSDSTAQAAIMAQTEELAATLAAQEGMEVESLQYRYLDRRLLLEDGEVTYADADGYLAYTTDIPASAYYSAYIVPLEDYNAATGQAKTLGRDEIILASTRATGLTTLPANGGDLTVVEELPQSPFTNGKNSKRESSLFIIVPDLATAQRLATSINPGLEDMRLRSVLLVDIDAAQTEGKALSEALLSQFRAWSYDAAHGKDGTYNAESIYINREDGYSLYGGLLFLGVFFAILFLILTVLILYFKQISEGFDDRDRFEILQKVGLSDAEVRSTINRQMLIVFLLPLVVALIHIAAASNMIRQMLSTFMLTDFGLTMLCIVVTSAVFAVVYLCVYRLTARTYYRLVKW